MSDRLLSAVANTVQNCLRQADSLGHLENGGFGLLLPETNAQSATAVAKRIQYALSQLSLEFIDLKPEIEPSPLDSQRPNGCHAAHILDPNVSKDNGFVISIGVAGWHPSDPDVDVTDIFQRAEVALAQAQCQSGNRIVVQTQTDL